MSLVRKLANPAAPFAARESPPQV